MSLAFVLSWEGHERELEAWRSERAGLRSLIPFCTIPISHGRVVNPAGLLFENHSQTGYWILQTTQICGEGVSFSALTETATINKRSLTRGIALGF